MEARNVNANLRAKDNVRQPMQRHKKGQLGRRNRRNRAHKGSERTATRGGRRGTSINEKTNSHNSTFIMGEIKIQMGLYKKPGKSQSHTFKVRILSLPAIASSLVKGICCVLLYRVSGRAGEPTLRTGLRSPTGF